MQKDIRWKQRFSNYEKALSNLEAAIATSKEHTLSRLEKQGLIKAFEFTFELAWNTIKDFYANQGEDIQGSRDAVRLAFNRGLIQNGESWMKMIDDRNLTSHSYNENIAEEIYADIVNIFHSEFKLFQNTMKTKLT